MLISPFPNQWFSAVSGILPDANKNLKITIITSFD
jgi:hypothetical protein